MAGKDQDRSTDSTNRADSAPTEAYDDQLSADGLVHDEYTDPNYRDPNRIDALDMAGSLDGEGMLADVADESVDGIEEVDTLRSSQQGLMADTVDAGVEHDRVAEMADMGFGTEAHTADELADAAIGHELRGRRSVTRDDQVHGEALFDEQNGERDGAGM